MNKLRTRNKLIFGVGINDSDYNIETIVDGKRILCKYYQTWHSMLRRCYSSIYQAKCPTYIGCTVVEEWFNFSIFRNWMMLQDWKGKQLDKDLLFQGNKVYSSETCLFVTNSINSLFIKSDGSRGQYKIGVSFKKETGKYQANCNVKGKLKFLGYYLTEEEAHTVYKIFKTAHIRTIALEQSDIRLKEAMLRYVVE